MEIALTEHAKYRLKKRKITEEEVKEAVKYPDKLLKKQGKYYVQKNISRASIEVVNEKDKYIKVITAYYI